MSEEHSGSSSIGFFLAGLGIGAILALLFAPRSGQETRDLIAERAGEGRDYVKTRADELRQQAEDAVEKGKELVSKEKERLAEVFEAGKEAARSKLSIV